MKLVTHPGASPALTGMFWKYPMFLCGWRHSFYLKARQSCRREPAYVVFLFFPLEDRYWINANAPESSRIETRPIRPWGRPFLIGCIDSPARRYLSLYLMFQLSLRWKNKMEGRDKGAALHNSGSPGTGSSPDSCYDKHSDQN